MKAAQTVRRLFLQKAVCIFLILMPVAGISQTTIVNYNFDVSSIGNYQKFYARPVNGITCVLSSSDAYDGTAHSTNSSLGGTVTGASAFTQNTASSPNRIVGLSTSGSGKYFIFRVSGSSIKAYNTFKIYYQARQNATGRTIQAAYSVDGGAYTNFGSAVSIGTAFTESGVIALPSVAPTSTLDIKLTLGGTPTGLFRLDNFQVQAVGPSSATVAIASNHPSAGNVFQNTINNVIAGFRVDAHIAAITPSSIIMTTGGSYLSTDAVNFKLWQSSYNSLNGATQVGSTVASGGPGTNLTFNSGFNSIASGASAYFFLTADVAAAAVAGNTINITTTAFTNVSFSGSPAKVGVDPVAVGNTQTITANLGTAASNINKYTSGSVSMSNLWNNGGSVSRWANVTGGPYTSQQWTPNSIAILEGSGATFQPDATTGPVVNQISATVNSYNLQATSTTVTAGITLANPGIIDVSSTNRLTMSNSNISNTNASPVSYTHLTLPTKRIV